MTKEEFILKKTAAERVIKALHPIPMGIFFSIIFAMIMAIPALIGLLCLVLFFHYSAAPPATILGELVFCLCLLAFTWFWCGRESQKLRIDFEHHGAKCPSCQKFLMFAHGDKTLKTGRCWNCGVQIFDH
ncbi:MAG TPA: hypothetical protein VGZ93_04110 [Candidatus Methylacidiphilales bacterium]|jgi:hypothetical protein|nr:hypothetical protein [Candidatus Methylacidiphilales bacterium]